MAISMTISMTISISMVILKIMSNSTLEKLNFKNQ